MSFKILATCALVAFSVLSGVASPVVASVEDELVRIPGRFIPKSNLHRVPDGGKVVHTPNAVHLVGADGVVLHTAPLTSPSPRVNQGLNFPGSSPGIAKRNLLSAIVAAVWQAPSVYSFSTYWTVPPLPQKYSGQLLYYFNALQPASGDALIQPVLQYGVSAAGGGPYWSVASWFIVGNNGYVTNLTAVPTGSQPVQGYIINNDEFFGTPTTHAWYSVFNYYQASQLNVQTTEVFNWAYEALEITNATSFANLPAQTTNLNNIALATQEGVYPSTIPWTVVNDTADGITMKVVSSSGVTGALQIKYPGQLF